MPRRLIATAVVLAVAAPAAAWADDATIDDVLDQELGARVGLAMGGRVTAGGLRIGGHYLYRLADADWFDGAVLFTFGGGAAACFRDRDNDVVCDHGRVQGFAGELIAGVRRFFVNDSSRIRPFVRAGAGVRVVHFDDDGVTGLAVPLVASGGARVRINEHVAVGAEAQLELGIGLFSRGLGGEPQAGLSIGAVVELPLP